MSKEIYVKKLPDCCMNCVCCHTEYDGASCYCSAFDNVHMCISGDIYAKGRIEECPLQSLHDHDKELVAKVLNRVKKELDGDYNQYRINYILDQIQKEYEK